MTAVRSGFEIEPCANTIKLIVISARCVSFAILLQRSDVPNALSFVEDLYVIDRLTLGVGPLCRNGHDLSIA